MNEPKENCKHCHGTGIVTDWVPYGSTNVPMDSDCDCMYEDEPEPDEPKEDVYAKYSSLLDGVECPICEGNGNVIPDVGDGLDVTCKTCKGEGYVTKEKYQEMLKSLPETRKD
jgi:DnaJ-class molecular chaperone